MACRQSGSFVASLQRRLHTSLWRGAKNLRSPITQDAGMRTRRLRAVPREFGIRLKLRG